MYSIAICCCPKSDGLKTRSSHNIHRPSPTPLPLPAKALQGGARSLTCILHIVHLNVYPGLISLNLLAVTTHIKGKNQNSATPVSGAFVTQYIYIYNTTNIRFVIVFWTRRKNAQRHRYNRVISNSSPNDNLC